jgi:hypothetical protein
MLWLGLFMRRAAQFVIVLVVGLGLVTWLASITVRRTVSSWFEKDVRLRAKLVVNGARRALVARWRPEEREQQKELLAEIAHDERIMSATACDMNCVALAQTPEFPGQVSCEQLGRMLGSQAEAGWGAWTGSERLPEGQVHVRAIPVSDTGQTQLLLDAFLESLVRLRAGSISLESAWVEEWRTSRPPGSSRLGVRAFR